MIGESCEEEEKRSSGCMMLKRSIGPATARYRSYVGLARFSLRHNQQNLPLVWQFGIVWVGPVTRPSMPHPPARVPSCIPP